MLLLLAEIIGAALVVAGVAVLEPALGLVAAGLYLLYVARDSR